MRRGTKTRMYKKAAAAILAATLVAIGSVAVGVYLGFIAWQVSAF